jgi:hypothetical protein
MEYRHTPPTLDELRKFRRQAARYLEKNSAIKPAGLFGRKNIPSSGELGKDITHEDLIHYELDVIIAHLENQNEMLLELMKKVDKL